MSPRITQHARDRCKEMGISTKVAKRIVRNPCLVLPDFRGRPGRQFLYSTDEPRYAVVVEKEGDRLVVVTVLYYSPHERFERV